MSLGEVFSPVGGFFKNGLSNVAHYWWVLFIFVGLAIAIAVIVFLKLKKDKNAQWTHTLKIRRVLQNKVLTDPVKIRMRRFPIIKRAEVFELENPLLGGYLIPELDSYSGVNEFSIIIDNNNRIYTNKGEFFAPDKSCVNVSAKHAEIDISRSELRADFQNIHKTSKRVEWGSIAKYAMISLLRVAVKTVSIVGLGKWGDAHTADAEKAKYETSAMQSLSDSLETNDATVNSQLLLADKLEEIYGNKNIQGLLKTSKNETS